jgi:hypothetical protein
MNTAMMSAKGLQLASRIEKMDTSSPRMAAYEKALQNARALKIVGAFNLARIEYDRAMRLNTNSTPEILKEKEELLQAGQATGMADTAEVEEVPLPGSPQWLYDSVVSLATRQFADRRFDSAIINYKAAGQIVPGHSFTESQVRAIEWELAQIWTSYVSARTDQLSKGARAALAQKRYAEALTTLYELMHYHPRDEEWVKTQYTNVARLLTNQGMDTEAMVAMVKFPDVWDVIKQNRPDPSIYVVPASLQVKQPESSAPADAPRLKPTGVSAVQTVVVPYSAAQLAEMFPGVDFTQPPPEQVLNLIDDKRDHASAIEKARNKPASLQLSDSTANIKVTCEGLYFKGPNTYLKVRVSNNSVSDFPVGPMLLTWKQRGRQPLERIPVAVSDYPVVQSGKFFSFIYVCRSVLMRDNEDLYFSLQGRLGFPKWQITIPGKVYNLEKNKRLNQL